MNEILHSARTSLTMRCFNLLIGMLAYIVGFGQPGSGNPGISLTWEECISIYRSLDESNEHAALLQFGTTDGGKPLHLFVINKDGTFEPELLDRRKTILLIMNSIHPGEPDGMDACVQWSRQLLSEPPSAGSVLDSLIICIIPVYNIDGALQRNRYGRVNQNGPAEYGFRGNARNLDLNRDFMKCDSENARSFARLFTRLKPHVFVDTHVSNGADYPYTMTLISTQYKKLGGRTGQYLRHSMEPALFGAMKNEGDEMCPYVHTMGRTPDSGLVDFPETPRFSTGYAALFNTIGFVTETHMLKPFSQRVESTLRFLRILADYCNKHSGEIVAIRNKADADLLGAHQIPIRFELDSTQADSISFSGYEALTERALIGSGQRLKYDHKKNWNRNIPYYRHYVPEEMVNVPAAYIVPQAWREVVERLKCNHVKMRPIPRDTVITVRATFLRDFETVEKPYEGHYIHSDLRTETQIQSVPFFAGDWIIDTSQPAKRYLIEALEPKAEDSFFSWNFFDSALQQKEWFSDYVFEEIAADLLSMDPSLKASFEQALKEDEKLASSHWQQLYWIYRHSPHYEATAFRYPVFRLE